MTPPLLFFGLVLGGLLALVVVEALVTWDDLAEAEADEARRRRFDDGVRRDGGAA